MARFRSELKQSATGCIVSQATVAVGWYPTTITMRVHQRGEEGNAEVWTATVYISDKTLKNNVEEYAEEHGVSESTAIVEILRNGQQALEQ